MIQNKNPALRIIESIDPLADHLRYLVQKNNLNEATLARTTGIPQPTLHMKIIKIIKWLIMEFILFLKEILITNTALYRIEEINMNTKMVIIRGRGARPICLKLNILKILYDPIVLTNLSPIDACWLGYYAGLEYDECFSKNILAYNMQKGFTLHALKGKFRIHSQNRKGSITYLNIKNNTILTDIPLAMAKDQSLIIHFDPTQACYIGLLAGISIVKNNFLQKKPLNIKPLLRLVK